MAHTPATGNHAPAHWRLGLALCASAAAHAWLLEVLPGSQRPPTAYPVSPYIEARMIAQEEGPGSNLVVREVGQAASALQAARESTLARTPQRRPAGQARVSAESKPALYAPARTAAALPPPIDLTWYGAHELDSYPRALAPLEFDRRSLAEPEHARARMLLWLRIDEQGRIVEITAGEADIPPELLEAARVTLAGVTFAPARKDERAVKSRLLLSVTLGDAFNRER